MTHRQHFELICGLVDPVENQVRVAGQGEAARTLPPLVTSFRVTEQKCEGFLYRRLDPLCALRVARLQVSGNVLKVGIGLRREA